MRSSTSLVVLLLSGFGLLAASEQLANPPPFPAAPEQALERTCFQTGSPWSSNGNLPGDVAIVYGIDPTHAARVKTWRLSSDLRNLCTSSFLIR